MDEIVVQAMAKWPNVPAAYGWLRLDRRGGWRLIDRNTPGFDEAAHGAGTRIEHAAFADTICRNYQADDQGRWYFQNGPQRVFVDLELAPLVLRAFDARRRAPLQPGSPADPAPAVAAAPAPAADEPSAPALVAHTGYPVARATEGLIDTHGNVFVDTDLGPGVIHDADLAALPIEPIDGTDDTLRLRLATGDVLLRRTTQDAARVLRFERRPRS